MREGKRAASRCEEKGAESSSFLQQIPVIILTPLTSIIEQFSGEFQFALTWLIHVKCIPITSEHHNRFYDFVA